MATKFMPQIHDKRYGSTAVQLVCLWTHVVVLGSS